MYINTQLYSIIYVYTIIFITVVTFLHKRVFCPKALVVTRNWYKPRDKKASSNRQQQEGRTFKDVLILTFRQK